MTGIEMPMQLKDISKFERQNDISVSVYGWEPQKRKKDGEIEPGYAFTLRITEEVKLRHVNLLMIGDEVKHYCWIKHFSRLVRSQYTGAKVEHAYCRFCISGSMVKLSLVSVHDLKMLNVDGMNTKRSASDMVVRKLRFLRSYLLNLKLFKSR